MEQFFFYQSAGGRCVLALYLFFSSSDHFCPTTWTDTNHTSFELPLQCTPRFLLTDTNIFHLLLYPQNSFHSALSTASQAMDFFIVLEFLCFFKGGQVSIVQCPLGIVLLGHLYRILHSNSMCSGASEQKTIHNTPGSCLSIWTYF